MISQRENILKYIREHGSITPMEALSEFGCFRLSGRIFELRQQGWNINTEQMFSNGKVFARYVLEKEDGGTENVCQDDHQE